METEILLILNVRKNIPEDGGLATEINWKLTG
jgi:hypothetical protein